MMRRKSVVVQTVALAEVEMSQNFKKAVYVVGGDPSVEAIFKAKGWVVTTRFDIARDCPPDLVCFTGGSDVSPHLYGEENLKSHCNEARDNFEVEVFHEFNGEVPFVGICRGAQLLNILAGGKMIQDLPKSQHGEKPLDIDIYGDPAPLERRIETYACHHQGILVPKPENSLFSYAHHLGSPYNEIALGVWFPEIKGLGIQSHPEWGHKQTHDLFFNLISKYLEM